MKEKSPMKKKKEGARTFAEVSDSDEDILEKKVKPTLPEKSSSKTT